MKRFLILLLLVLGLDVRAAHVTFTMEDFTAQPLLSRTLTLFPLGAPFTNGAGGIVSRDRRTVSTGTNGSVTVSNIYGGVYRTELKGTSATTTNFFVFPVTNGIINAATYLAALNNGVYSVTISTGDTIVTGGDSVFTNDAGSIGLTTNAPIYIDLLLTGSGFTYGHEFDVSPGTGSATDKGRGLVSFNSLFPLGSFGVENNNGGQIGIQGGALQYSGTVTNGSAAGVSGMTESAYALGIGVVGTSFGISGSTNIGVVGSSQAGSVRIGLYGETRGTRSSSSRQYISSAILGDSWDTNELLTLRSNGIPLAGVHSNGVFYGDGSLLTGLNSFSNSAMIWVDPVNGNDTTGKRGNQSRPFKTIWNIEDKTAHTYYGAVTVAEAGDTVIALPGLHWAPTIPLNMSTSEGVHLWIQPGASVVRTNKYYSKTGAIQSLLTADLSSAGPMVIPGNNSRIIVDGTLVATNATDGAIGWFDSIVTWLSFAFYGFTNRTATNITIGGNGSIYGAIDTLYFAQTNTSTSSLTVTDVRLYGTYDYLKVSGKMNLLTKNVWGLATNAPTFNIAQGVNLDSGVFWNDYGSTFGCSGGVTVNTPVSLTTSTNVFNGTRLYSTSAILLPGASDNAYFYSTNSTVSGCVTFQDSSGTLVYSTCGGVSSPFTNSVVVWVDPGGDDTTGVRGVREKPFKTLYNIQDKTAHTYYGAVTVAQPGDTIVVLPGTHYAPSVPLNMYGPGANGVNLYVMAGATVVRTNKYYSKTGSVQSILTAALTSAGPMVIPGNNSSIVIDGQLIATNSSIDASIGWLDSLVTWQTIAFYGFTNRTATNVTIYGSGAIIGYYDSLYFAQTNTSVSSVTVKDLRLFGSYDYLKVSGKMNLTTKGLSGLATNEPAANIAQGVNLDSGVYWLDDNSTFGCAGGITVNQPLSMTQTTNVFNGTRLYSTTAIILSGASQNPYYLATNSTISGCVTFQDSSGNVVYNSCALAQNFGTATNASLYGTVILPATTNSTTGVIIKGGQSFLHDYKAPSSDGENTFIGTSSGNFTMSPGGGATTLASANTAVGFSTLDALTTGYQNSAFGRGALHNNTTGPVNNAFGYGALYSNTTGGSDSAFGDTTMFYNTTGSGNSAFGADALAFNTTGWNNTVMGKSAMYANIIGSNNVAIGQDALRMNTNGSENVAIGTLAVHEQKRGTNNIGIGYSALYENISGSQNTVVGAGALNFNTNSSDNVAIGYYAGRSSVSYSNKGNVIIGSSAGYNHKNASDYNVLVGYASGNGMTTGNRNILIGASEFSTGQNQVTTGTQNISIGHNVALASATGNYQLNIGNLIYGTNLYGEGATISPGGIGIGVKAPATTFHVKGPTTIENGGLNATLGTQINLQSVGFPDSYGASIKSSASSTIDQNLIVFVVGSGGGSGTAVTNALTLVGDGNVQVAQTLNATNGFAVGASTGMTTNINVLIAGGTTNQLRFTKGILTGVVPQ